jgi:RNA polymerase sigma-70 factor (ECF subfamily)
MAAASAHPLLRFIRQITAVGGTGDAPDAQLLDRFVAWRDEDAFAALLRRYGSTVFGVCRRVLGNTPDAEDAFQATFLVLVRRARSLGRPELLGSWLYGVAYRTALKARVTAARRRRHEGRAAQRYVPNEAGDEAWGDLGPVLDEELSRLPAKYREPVVLCHLEGLTHEEAARRLGCPRETVTTRLTRARERLRSQMVRRGVTLSAAALATPLARDALGAAVPAALAAGTTRAVVLAATGRWAAAGISAQVTALTEGVLRAMWMTKLKVVTVVLLGVVLAAWGAGALAPHPLAAEQPREATQVTAPADPAPVEPADGQKAAKGPSVKDLPAVVVRTVPQAGDTQVDAKKTKEIRVTFSKDMQDKSWSWSQISDDTFPGDNGAPHYDKDRRTCVLPVKLEPGKTYVIWLNSERFGHFKDTDGRSAVPYLLVFETKP